jgi:DNA-binding LytR/AlgR family response regulator
MNTEKLITCVIDDEKLIRQTLIETLNESIYFSVQGEADSVSTGEKILKGKRFDAVFMDIKLREGDAFQVLNTLKKEHIYIPPIVLITGYNDFEYAQRTFNEFKDYVVRILQKPFWESWETKEQEILESINLHLELHEEKTSFSKDKMSIKSDYKTYLLHYDEIKFIEVSEELKGSGKLKIVTLDQEFIISHSLKTIQQELPKSFIQISRFAIVNAERISYFDHTDHVLFLKGMDRNFSVGQAYLMDLLKWMEK